MSRSNDRRKFRDRDQTIEIDRSIEIDRTIGGNNHRWNHQTKSIKRSIDRWIVWKGNVRDALPYTDPGRSERLSHFSMPLRKRRRRKSRLIDRWIVWSMKRSIDRNRSIVRTTQRENWEKLKRKCEKRVAINGPRLNWKAYSLFFNAIAKACVECRRRKANR